MQRKRRSGASDDGIAEVPVPCGFPRVRGIWFTVAFRETITIAAIGRAGRRVTRHWRIQRIESGLYGPAQECRPLSGTRTIARRARAAGVKIDNGGNLGRRAAHHRRRHKERGRRRTRQDQISHEAQNQLEALRPPVKLRIMGSRTERRKPVSSAGPVFEKSEPS